MNTQNTHLIVGDETQELDLNSFNSYIYKNRKDIINQYYDILVEETERIKNNVAQNKDWLEKQPVMQDFLNKLQFMLQEKNIAFFNSLITALSKDVIGNDDEERSKEINFDLYVKGGMPALKINAKTFDNNIEKITSGGLKNVIATGLRVLALWRLTMNENNTAHRGEFSHRKFLFLDEPDCWIGKMSMPNYAKLLHQLSTHFNLQILMVTHNDVDYFSPYAKVYKLSNIDGNVNIELLSDISNDGDECSSDVMNTDLIKSFELRNFKAHQITKVELSPHLTVIVGKSDSGKSVIMEAFNAVINNVSDDDVIRHFENKASVTLEVGNHIVLWERVRKTNTENPQKVRYKLYDYDDKQELRLLHDAFDSYDTPEFIQKVLKMKKFEDVDVHLGLQEDMTFLFNPKISDYERAKILSLGKESSYINTMMENLKSKTREIKSEVKIGEKRYNQLLFAITDLDEVDHDNQEYQKLSVLEKQVANSREMINSIGSLLYQLELLNNIADISMICDADLSDLEALNILIDKTNKLIESTNMFFQYQNDEIISQLSLLDSNEDIDSLLSQIDTWLQNFDMVNGILAYDFDFVKFIPDDTKDVDALFVTINDGLKHIVDVDSLGKLIRLEQDNLIQFIEEEKNLTGELERTNELIHSLEHQLGVCPTCGHSFD